MSYILLLTRKYSTNQSNSLLTTSIVFGVSCLYIQLTNIGIICVCRVKYVSLLVNNRLYLYVYYFNSLLKRISSNSQIHQCLKQLNKLMTRPHLFIDTYKYNKIKVGMNEMTVNDGEMCVRCRRTMSWNLLICNQLEHSRLSSTGKEAAFHKEFDIVHSAVKNDMESSEKEIGFNNLVWFILLPYQHNDG